MGLRGPAPNPSRLRTERVRVRLHPSEKMQLERLASDSDMTMSEFIRSKLGLRRVMPEPGDS